MIRTRLGIACGLALGLAAGSAAQSPYYAFEQIGVGTSAVGFTVGKIAATSGHPQALLASCRVETAEIRYTTDGTTPTASVGTLLEVGDVVTLSDTGQLARFQAIRTGGTSGQLDCFYSGSANGIVLAPAANVSATVSASNPAASATGAAVPAQASYTGINVGGNTTGWTGFSLGTARAGAMAIVDGSGNQITSFGGGTQYTNGSAQATPTGTMALGFDGANVRALATDTSGHLAVNFAATPTINSAQSGTWNFRLQDGSGNAITSDTRGLERPLSVQILDGSGNQVTSFGGSGGTASNFGSAFPSAGTAVGFKDSTGANMAAGNLDASGNLKTLSVGAITPADAFANPTTAVTSWSLNGCWNGTTWDRCKSATLGNGTNANAQLVTIASDSTGQIKATNLPTTVTSNAGAADASTIRVVNDPLWGGATAKGVSSAISTTTSTQVVAAVGSNYLYITSCQVTQSSTTVGTAVNLQDGSGGTTLATIPAPAAANSVGVSGSAIVFPTPIKVTTLGNGLFAAAVTTGSNFVVSCQGFSSTVSR